MPHILVQLWPGRDEETKQRLADALAAEAARVLDVSRDALSVSLEEIAREDWKERVWQREIQAKPELLYQAPGYSYDE